MEKNYIGWLGTTHFYVDLVKKEYGVRISVEDTSKADEIIEYFRNDRKEQIEAWKKEWEVGVIV